MTPDDLRAWLVRMGYTQQQAASALGVDRVSFARMLAGTAPINMRTGLACAAIAAGLKPWAAA
jgi:DNA-binding XRE family transcriptional regulator